MKRITILAATAMMVLCTIDVAAQIAVHVDSTRTSNVKVFQSNVGITGFNMAEQRAGVEWPRGSGHHFLFAGGMWLGAVVDSDTSIDSLVFIAYNPNSGRSWAAPESVLQYTVVDGVEQFSTVFSDIDLEFYEGSAERRKEQGFPLGLKFSQVLTSGGSGVYKDAYSVSTTVTNTNQTRILRDLVLGMALDVDINGTGIGIKAFLNDTMRVIPATTGPIVQVFDDLDSSTGVMGIAMVKSPQNEGLHTSTIWPDYGLEFTDDKRYRRLTSGVIDTGKTDRDLRLIIGHKPTVLGPGMSITVTVLFMFAASMSEETDQHMIDVVDGWGVQSSVDEDVSRTALKVYPNPARTSDVIHVESSAPVTRTELVNVLGEVVAMSSTEPGMISAGSVPQGWYLIRAFTETDVISEAIVIAN